MDPAAHEEAYNAYVRAYRAAIAQDQSSVPIAPLQNNPHDTYVAYARSLMTPTQAPAPIPSTQAFQDAINNQFWRTGQQIATVEARVRVLEDQNMALKESLITYQKRSEDLEHFIMQQIAQSQRAPSPQMPTGTPMYTGGQSAGFPHPHQHIHMPTQNPNNRQTGRACSGPNCESFMDIDSSSAASTSGYESTVVNTPRAVRRVNLPPSKSTVPPSTSSEESDDDSSASDTSSSDASTEGPDDTTPRPSPRSSASASVSHSFDKKSFNSEDPAAYNPAFFAMQKEPKTNHEQFVTLVRAQNLKIKTENRTNFNLNSDCTLYALLEVRTGKAIVGFPKTVGDICDVDEEMLDRILHAIGVGALDGPLPHKRRRVLQATVAGMP